MTRWKIETKEFEQREKDYSAGFLCTNTETGKTVHIMVTQGHPGFPATDLVQSLTALANLFKRVNSTDDDTNTVTIQ